MKKKDKEAKKPQGKQGKAQKKEKKQKDPKEYIPQNLLSELRPTKLITSPSINPSTQNAEDEAEKNYSPDYKPEYIPCKIPEEWNHSIEEEINNEFNLYEKELEEMNNNPENNNPSQDLKKGTTHNKRDDKKKMTIKENLKEKDNKKKDENKSNDKVEEEEEDQVEVDPEIIKKLNHVMKYEDDSDRYIDPEDQTLKDNLPLYLVDILRNEIKWKRPKKYILHHFLWEKVKMVFPKKKMSVICEEIIDTYKDYLLKIINGEILNYEDDEEQNLNEYLSDKNASIKNRIYKEFFPIIDQDYDIKIADSFQRLENEAEYHKRIEIDNNINNNLNVEDKNKKNTNKKMTQKKKEINEEKQMINDMKPNSLKLNTNSACSNSFYTWMTSIFQFILDNNITDINTKRSILFNIYPQKDGIPIYNPKGKYIIKLYLMGKERKIIIDDTMPFTYDDEFIFPGCENINEIWPVLFTKALLKLNMYKYRHPYYYKNEEFNDISFIYNLTGKYVFSFPLYDQQINSLLIQEYNENILNFNSKYVFGFYKIAKTKSMKITQLYQSYEERITDLNNRLREKEKSKHLIPLIQSINSGLSPKKKTKQKSKFGEDIFHFGEKTNLSINKNEDGTVFKRRKKKFGTLSINDPKKVVNTLRVQEENLIDGEVVKNYLYTINDYFESKKYNMRRTKKIKFNDLEIENEETKWEFKQLNINEKKDYMIRRRDLKKQHKEERIKRIELLKKIPDNNEYKLYKINTNCINIPKNYKKFELYDDKEISMGRKCLANGWEFPPIEFFDFDKLPQSPINENDLKLNKIRNNEEMMKYKKIKKTMALYGWTLENFKELCDNNYIEEKTLDENNIIKTRKSEDKTGIWFENKKINQLFDKILVVFNEDELYKSNLFCDNGYYNYLTDVYEPVEEYQAFYLINEKLQAEKESALLNNDHSKTKSTKYNNNATTAQNNNSNINNISSNINAGNENYGINIVFMPYIEQLYMSPQPEVYLMPYINIDIYDCETQSKIFSKITLNQFFSSFYSDKFDNNGEYYIIITDGYYPCGYTLNIASNGFCIKNMTRNKFYQQILNYKTKEFNLDFPNLDKDKLWLFGKILITNNSSQKTSIKFKLNINYQIKQILPFIKVFLENQNINEKRREIQLDEFMTLDQENTEEIKSKDYITILIKPEYLLKSSNIDIEILYDNDEFNFELLDLVQPYEIIGDTFESNNNGLIFSEYIYPSEAEVVSFLDLSIRYIDNKGVENIIENGEIDFKLELYELLNEPNINFEQNSIHFSYSNLGNLLKSWIFYNDINLSNIVFYSRKLQPKEEEITGGDNKKNEKKIKKPNAAQSKSKNENVLPYILICYVNDRFNNTFNFDNIKWKIRIFSDNIISFVKDLSKINHEDKIKTEWEVNEPGRKLKASDSRKKFLIYKKNIKGDKLTEEEKQILKKERRRITDTEKEEKEKEENDKNNGKKHNNTNKKSRNNKKETSKNTTHNQSSNNDTGNTIMYTKINKLPIIHSRYLLDSNQFRMNRILKDNKKIDNYHSLFISNYVNYINQKRVIHYGGLQKNISILNQEFLEKYSQKILNDFETSEKNIKKENYFVKSKEDKNDIDDKNFNKFLNKFGKVRLKASDSMKNLMVRRNVLNKGFIDKIAIEKKMNEIFELFKSRDNSLITTNEKNDKKDKNNKAEINKFDIDINEMINVLEKAKELLPGDDKRLEEMTRLIEIRKEEIAAKAAMTANKGKNKKK